MKISGNIHLLGTSHIAKDSVRQVKESILHLNPDIIAVELDPGRAYALKNSIPRPKGLGLIKHLGLGGAIFYFFGQIIQSKLGKIVEIDPGSEMLAALETAEEKKIKVALIDRDIMITLRRFSRHFRKRELLRMLADAFFGIFKKEKLEIDLSKVPPEELITFILTEVKTHYPSLYKVLIDERDIYMARNLFHTSSAFRDKKILAIVGAGHVSGILKYLTEMEEKSKDNA